MFKNRILFDSDITLKNEYVGFGTDTPLDRLHVAGTVKGIDFKIDGESTYTSYGGFVYENHLVDLDFTLEYTTYDLANDVIVSEDKYFAVYGDSVLSISTVESLNVDNHLGVPVGGTNVRSDQPVEGMVRFNDDLNTLEFYNGIDWRQFTVTGASGRGVFGSNGTYGYVNIHTLGNAEYFGDAVSGVEIRAAFGSSTRGVWGGGLNETGIEYVTIASAGNAISFGNLTAQYFRNTGGCSSSTRGLFYGGGLPTYYNVIEYVEINTLGNSLDFGDQTNANGVKTCFSSPTRGFSMGGFPSYLTTIDMVTIASKGNAIEFGNMTRNFISMGGFANSVRGVFGGGYKPALYGSNFIEYITMSSSGSGTDFGDLTQGRAYPAGVSTQTRGIFAGGTLSPGTVSVNTIDYITISTTGNAQDFGDHIESQTRMRGTSDSHGGLGGF